MSKMFKVLLIALIAIAGCSFGYLAYAGTDTYDDGKWKITSDGDLIPITNNASTIGNSSYYPESITLDAQSRAFWGKTKALPTGSTITADFSEASVFTLTPHENLTISTTGAGGIPGTIVTLVITGSSVTNRLITFSTGFKSSGTIGSGNYDLGVRTIQFVSDGVNWNEVSRTTGQYKAM